jgi:hypothetical protein
MDGFSVAWLMWLAMFGVIEGVALVRKEPGDTLSEHMWRWFAVKDKPNGWRARRSVLGVFLVWLTGHLLGVI